MHSVQIKLLELAKTQNLAKLSLRSIGELIGIGAKPQIVSHHLEQLQKKGFIVIDRNRDYMKLTTEVSDKDELIRLPILGAANCGAASLFASESIEGYLTISKRLMGASGTGGLYALRAVGDSMNDGKLPLLGGGYGSIDEGDYVLADSEDKDIRDGDIVVSDIDGLANIKRISLRNGVIVLLSQSKNQAHHPIFVDSKEVNYYICGKVKKVIKFGLAKNT